MAIIDPEQTLADVNMALQSDTRIDIDALILELSIDEDFIVLDGSVDNIREKRIAANVAERAAPRGITVRDRLQVRGETVSELEFRDEVVRTLSAEAIFLDHTLIVEAGGHRQTVRQGAPGAGRIDIGIDDGCVALEGQVVSLSHRRFAEVLVWWIAACRRVDNRLQVVPPQRDHDNEINDVVQMVLEKDPLVHAAQLRVGTAAGIVEIQGLVTSEEERRLAVADVWYVPGVWDVVDRIEIRP